MSIGDGSFAAAAVNMDLIAEDIACAVAEYSEQETECLAEITGRRLKHASYV